MEKQVLGLGLIAMGAFKALEDENNAEMSALNEINYLKIISTYLFA